MEKKTILINYEKEYSSDVDSTIVTVDDLIKNGVSKETLAAEVYLRKIYGDEIVKKSLSDEIDETKQKTVKKIGEEEKNIDKELRSIWQDVDESEFDKNIDSIV